MAKDGVKFVIRIMITTGETIHIEDTHTTAHNTSWTADKYIPEGISLLVAIATKVGRGIKSKGMDYEEAEAKFRSLTGVIFEISRRNGRLSTGQR
jgi:hypothetical protein